MPRSNLAWELLNFKILETILGNKENIGISAISQGKKNFLKIMFFHDNHQIRLANYLALGQALAEAQIIINVEDINILYLHPNIDGKFFPVDEHSINKIKNNFNKKLEEYINPEEKELEHNFLKRIAPQVKKNLSFTQKIEAEAKRAMSIFI